MLQDAEETLLHSEAEVRLGVAISNRNSTADMRPKLYSARAPEWRDVRRQRRRDVRRQRRRRQAAAAGTCPAFRGWQAIDGALSCSK